MGNGSLPMALPELAIYRTSKSRRLALCRHLAKYGSFVPLTQPFLKDPLKSLDVISNE